MYLRDPHRVDVGRPTTSSPEADRSMRYLRDRLAHGPSGQRRVSKAILSSWQLAADSGLIPKDIRPPYDANVDVGGRLRQAAAPAMAAVLADLGDVQVALLLVDDRGRVIERWAAPKTASAMDQVGAIAGSVCTDAIVGTNSIGTALRTRGPAVVLGFEHYADGLTAMSGAAGAVTDPLTGQQLGAVNMTCSPTSYNAMMPALIGRVVYETEQRLLDDADGTATALYAAFLQARRRAKGPVAAVDARSMFVNTAGASIVAGADRAVLWDWAQPRLATSAAPVLAELTLGSGTHPVRCEAAYDGDRIAGALIWVGTAGPPIPVPTLIADRTERWTALTGAERSVAEHVANGLTNRETASQLLISTHTVDYHLRHIFRKLGLRSRVDVARVVASADRSGT